MVEYKLDITGKVCPYCILFTRKKVSKIASGDTLIVKCDHPPESENIPFDMKKAGHNVEINLVKPGLWEIIIIKK